MSSIRAFIAQIPLMRRLYRTVRAALSPEARSVRRVQRRRGALLFQPNPRTYFDRHPALFVFAHERLAGRADLRILSFGCSTGEEPISLAAYLPHAAIDAVDINPRSIALARRKARQHGCQHIAFSVGAQPPQADEIYDAVFCLSVFRHTRLEGERPASCAAILPFAKFEAVITAIDRTLRPGGLLFIWGSHFRLEDSQLAPRYRPLAVTDGPPQPATCYGPDDRLIADIEAVHFVFEKVGQIYRTPP